MFQSGCHGNLVTIATRYVTDPYRPKSLHTKYRLSKTKELLTYHCGCHGSLVTIATTCVAEAHHSEEPPYQIWT